jgi:hypothetical protein
MLATTFGTISAGLVMTAVARDLRFYAIGALALAFMLLFGSFWWRADLSGTRFDSLGGIEFANGGDAYFENGGPKPPRPDQPPLPRSVVKAEGNVATATITTIQEGSVVLPVQYSRHLVAQMNGSSTAISNSNGLVSIILPAGISSIYIRRDEPIGFVIGPCIAIVLFGLLVFRRSRPAPVTYKTPGPLVVADVRGRPGVD